MFVRHIPLLALTCLAGLVITNDLAGQPAKPAQPPADTAEPPAADPRLDALLMRWEKETAKCETVAVDLVCTRKNPVFNRTEKLVGYAKFMRLSNGEYAARLELRSQEDPNRYEKYICTGGYIYVFRPEEKLILVYTVPRQQAGQLPDDGALPFLFGLKAQVAKQRYRLRITKETEHYTYVEVLPVYPRDKADFTYARLAILNKDYPGLPKDLPKEIFWIEPTQVEVKWDIIRVQRDVPGTVQRSDFVKPELPPGWQWKSEASSSAAPAPSPRPPTVIRNQGG
ncbi:MAG: TIGR03009 domain-containing protein [Gemmatales bacterium]|nr:TIGR03009 domain-containing protein [Gemmatales bacterium]MDW8387828.1 TIGR03009 domain-containing protein [Gemmatales bacterium]